MTDTATVPADLTKVVPDSQVFELPAQLAADDDTPPNITVGNDKSPAPICGKEGCTNAVTKPVKGPYPKYCDDHRGTRDRSGSAGTRASSKGWAKAPAVEAALTQYVNMIGAGVTFINAEDGRAVTKHGPAVAHELVNVARDNAKLRKYLEMVATPGKYGPLALAVAGMVLPILANHDLIPKFVVSFVDDETPTK